MGLTDLISCKIDIVPGSKPVHKLPYRLNPHMRNEMDKVINEQRQLGLIEPATDGAWASPALLIRKAENKGYPLVCDYRALNAMTIPQFLRIPRIDDVLDAIGENQPKYFSVLDCTQGFHQIPIHPDSKDKTGFITPSGKFQYKTMPQGIKNAPMVFQSLMDKILQGIQYKYAMAYIDDICVFSPTFEKHIEHLETIFKKFQEANLKLHPNKCKFAVNKVNFLGHVLTTEGVCPDPEKVQAVKSYPTPSNLKELRAFLGLSGYFRKFIQNYAQIARPLYTLTTKNTPFIWSVECQSAFDKLKAVLSSDNVLIFPNFKHQFTLSCDASNMGIGTCLSQNVDGKNRPIAFAGRAFNKAEKNYSTTEQELLAVVWSIKHFRVYLEGRKFTLQTDHSALRWILSLKDPSNRLARWVACIQQYDFEVVHVKGKDNVVPDALSRRHYNTTHTSADVLIDEYPSLPYPFPDPTESNDDAKLNEPSKPSFQTFPENQGTLSSVEKENLRSNLSAVQTRSMKRREKIVTTVQPSATELLENQTFSKNNIKLEQKQDPQISPIVEYLESGHLPDNPKQARSILLRQEDYFLIDGILFHLFTSHGPQASKASAQLVVPQNLRKTLLEQHHDDPLGGHLGTSRMISVMRPRYFWLGMIKDITEYVRSCKMCNTAKPSNLTLSPPLTIRDPAPGPFHTLFIDTVGPLPRTQRSNKHLMCVTDQYSRYVIAWPTPDITAKSIAQKFYEKVICVHGCPKRLLSDNGSAFISDLFKELCSLYNIQQIFSTSYSPQSQGQVERAQKSIVTLLRTFVSSKQTNWDQFLPSLTWALNTSDNSPLGCSSFFHGLWETTCVSLTSRLTRFRQLCFCTSSAH